MRVHRRVGALAVLTELLVLISTRAIKEFRIGPA